MLLVLSECFLLLCAWSADNHAEFPPGLIKLYETKHHTSMTLLQLTVYIKLVVKSLYIKKDTWIKFLYCNNNILGRTSSVHLRCHFFGLMVRLENVALQQLSWTSTVAKDTTVAGQEEVNFCYSERHPNSVKSKVQKCLWHSLLFLLHTEQQSDICFLSQWIWIVSLKSHRLA